jgi:curved DNA-binding protein CbpA
MNHYETLGVDSDATLDEIKKAYRAFAKELHPDKGGDEEQFKALNRAYVVLSDSEKREFYDLHGDIDEAKQNRLDEVLGAMIEDALNAEASDVAKHVLDEIRQGVAEMNRKERQLEKREAKLKKSVKRVKCKRGSDPITSRINAKLSAIASERSRIEQGREALDYVKARIEGDFEFEKTERTIEPVYGMPGSFSPFDMDSFKSMMKRSVNYDDEL